MALNELMPEKVKEKWMDISIVKRDTGLLNVKDLPTYGKLQRCRSTGMDAGIPQLDWVQLRSDELVLGVELNTGGGAMIEY